MNDILRDRVLLDLIERLEGVRDVLEQNNTFPRVFVDNALVATVDYLVALRQRWLDGGRA
jgi:hypothetical protein